MAQAESIYRKCTQDPQVASMVLLQFGTVALFNGFLIGLRYIKSSPSERTEVLTLGIVEAAALLLFCFFKLFGNLQVDVENRLGCCGSAPACCRSWWCNPCYICGEVPCVWPWFLSTTFLLTYLLALLADISLTLHKQAESIVVLDAATLVSLLIIYFGDLSKVFQKGQPVATQVEDVSSFAHDQTGLSMSEDIEDRQARRQ